jgi:hypothetical protein
VLTENRFRGDCDVRTGAWNCITYSNDAEA